MEKEITRAAKSTALGASGKEDSCLYCRDFFMPFVASRNDIPDNIDCIRGIIYANYSG
jgi:hypothetical protein